MFTVYSHSLMILNIHVGSVSFSVFSVKVVRRVVGTYGRENMIEIENTPYMYTVNLYRRPIYQVFPDY